MKYFIPNELATKANINSFAYIDLSMPSNADDAFAYATALLASHDAVIFGNRTYELSETLEIGGKSLIFGNSSLLIPAAGFVGTELITATGSVASNPTLAVDTVIGSNTATFNAGHGITRGMIIAFFNPTDYSYSGYMPVYKDGELNEVVNVAGDVVTFAMPLLNSYVAADITVSILDTPTPYIEGMNFELDTSGIVPLKFTYCNRPRVLGFNGYCKASSGLNFNKSYGGGATELHLVNDGSGGSSDYGISINNATGQIIMNGYVKGRRHAVQMGGDGADNCVPYNNIFVTNLSVSNDKATTLQTLDFHGNGRNSEYNNIDVDGYVDLGGQNNGYESCTIKPYSNNPFVLAVELYGDLAYINNCKGETAGRPAASSRGFIDIGGNSVGVTDDLVTALDFQVNNCDFTITGANALDQFVKFVNRGTEKAVSIAVSGVVNSNATLALISTNLMSGVAASNGFRVSYINGLPAGSFYAIHTGNYYRDFPHYLPIQTGTSSFVTTNSTQTIQAKANYDIRYPAGKLPNLTLNIGSGTGAAFTPTLGSSVIPTMYKYAWDNTGYQASLLTTGTAMVAGTTVSVNYVAQLDGE